jgi:hypothetical protein
LLCLVLVLGLLRFANAETNRREQKPLVVRVAPKPFLSSRTFAYIVPRLQNPPQANGDDLGEDEPNFAQEIAPEVDPEEPDDADDSDLDDLSSRGVRR